jgi:hypothetical protein
MLYAQHTRPWTNPGRWHLWSAALLLATLATPAAVVIAWLAPRPLDAVVAFPLVLVDMWATSHGVAGRASRPNDDAPIARLVLLLLGIGLTWLFYVLAARLVLWRLSLDAGDGVDRTV